MTNAAESGRFRIGGAFDVNRLGFGAMRIVGRGIWGPPADRTEALKTLRRLPDFGVDFIDTADSYGPSFSEELIREALAPYGKIHIAGLRAPARTSGFPLAGRNI
jgi:aryl-alcohol dehydrogenase-like predicted oxidoreductase